MLKATAPDSRRIIVVLTDNSYSGPEALISQRPVMQQLSASSSVVCGVFVPYPPPESIGTSKYSSGIATYVDETGGLVQTVKDFTPREISARLVKTLDAFRNYYRIEYYSTNLKRDGKHREIKVTLSPDAKKRGGKLRVLSSRGYYAP